MLLGIDTDAGLREAEAARQQAIAVELAWREQELARWSIILTAAVGGAAAAAAAVMFYQHRSSRRTSP